MILKNGELHVYIDESGEIRPADDESNNRLKRMKKGHYFSFQYKRIRNYEFHKKFFSMLTLAFENQEFYENFEWFRQATLLGAGHCDTHIDKDGNPLYKVKSISFENCKQEDFELIYDNVNRYLLGRYGFTEEFNNELLSYK